MTIDPARLARIRSRLLAAAALTAVGSAGCGAPDRVNTPAPEPIINEPAPTAHTPINQRAPDTAPTAPPSAEPAIEDVNRPKPDATPPADPGPEPKHINTPPPDRPSPPDPGRTINTPPAVAPAAPPASGSAAPSAPPSAPPKKDPGDRVNRPKPGP